MALQVFGLTLAAFSSGLDVWLAAGRIASQCTKYVHVYGVVGLVLPFITKSEVFKLAEEVLWNFDDAAALRFLQYQLEQIGMVAATASIMSAVATSGFNFKFLSEAHWTARFFFLTSLLSGLFCVYYAVKQLRILGTLITPADIRNWLRSPPERIRCRQKNWPSIKAVLILDTPRSLVATSAITYIVGLSIYLTSVYLMALDQDAGQLANRNIVISFYIALFFCLALYTKADLFDWHKDRNRTWLAVTLMFVTVRKLWAGTFDYDCEDELPKCSAGVLFPPTREPDIQKIPKQHSGKNYPDIVDDGRQQTTSNGSNQLPLLNDALEAVISSHKNAVEADQKLLLALKEVRRRSELLP